LRPPRQHLDPGGVLEQEFAARWASR